MTQIDEPNLDKIDQEITDILLEHLVLANDNGQPYIQYTDVAVDKIITLIATQVAEAEKQGALNALTQLKVDYMNEWVGIDPKTMGLKTAPLTYQAIIEDRIAQLRSTK